MNRKSPTTREIAALPTAPTAESATLALRESVTLMAPVIRWLLRNGVSYGAFADQLKAVFVDAARSELSRAGAKPTFSALSMLSGVHRKDVRTLETEPRDTDAASTAARSIPLASQVYTRWLTTRRYRKRNGEPKPLPRNGSGVTFESLAREISQDVHPRTVLDELMRLGLVQLENGVAVPVSASFVPSRHLDELTSLFAANAADHMAAAVQNLSGTGAPLLEHSLFADGLGVESVAHLQKLARSLWHDVFDTMVATATERVDLDAAIEPEAQNRVRFGVYFYSESQTLSKLSAKTPSADRASRPKRAPRARRIP